MLHLYEMKQPGFLLGCFHIFWKDLQSAQDWKSKNLWVNELAAMKSLFRTMKTTPVLTAGSWRSTILAKLLQALMLKALEMRFQKLHPLGRWMIEHWRHWQAKYVLRGGRRAKLGQIFFTNSALATSNCMVVASIINSTLGFTRVAQQIGETGFVSLQKNCKLCSQRQPTTWERSRFHLSSPQGMTGVGCGCVPSFHRLRNKANDWYST